MEQASMEAVLRDQYLLGEIIQRSVSSIAYIRCSTVNNIWYETARSLAISDLFARHKEQSFLGFMVEHEGVRGLEVEMVCPEGDPNNDTLQAMEAGLDEHAFTGELVIASTGALVLYEVTKQSVRDLGYHTRCPFSRTSPYRYAGSFIPKIPRDDIEHSSHTYGQFGVLTNTGKEPFSPIGFFDKDYVDHAIFTYPGVRFMSESPVFAHVCVHRNGHWERFLSQPLATPDAAVFHTAPYCVIDGKKLFMMYLVGRIVVFNMEQSSFSVLELPNGISTPTTSWFDYTVCKGDVGGIALVHFQEGKLNKWNLVALSGVLNWELVSTFDLDPAFNAILQKILIPGAHIVQVGVDWGDTTFQVRSASQGARFVFFTIGMDIAAFVADMINKTITEVPRVVQDGQIRRVFTMEENWPPKP